MSPVDAPTRPIQRPPNAAATHSAILAAVERNALDDGDATAAVMLGDDGAFGPGLTYERLAALTAGLSQAISDAVEPGEVVLVVGANDTAHVAWLCAGLAAGVRLLLLPPWMAEAEIVGLVRRSGARAVIADEGCAGCLPSLPRLDRHLAYGTVSATERNPCRSHADGAVVLHTSGTTGGGKLAQRDSTALDADGANVVEAIRLTSRDRVLAAIPLSHSYGVDMLAATLLAGATLEIMPRFDPGVVARRLRAGATVFPAVPFMIEMLAGIAGPGAETPKSCPRLIFSAGGVLPVATRVAFERSWGVRVGDLYGASELGAVSFNDPRSAAFKAGSIGRPMRDVSIRVVDPEDSARVLPIGQTGQIAVRAPSMLSSYLDGEPEICDGHWLTGDLGHMDVAGRLFLTGRLKLLIDTGGLKVNPLEIEAALARHPGIAECVVVPLPLSETVTKLRALFVAREGEQAPTPEEARAFLKCMLPPSKVPRVIERVESLPKSVSGKILRPVIWGE
jgi:long-chain acyl-CoA synthetase